MKHLNIQSLKKHFETPGFEQFKIFLVVLPDNYEREKIFQYILNKINIKKFNLTRCSKEDSLDQIINIYQSPSFFGGDPLIILGDIEEFSKDDIQKLNNYIKANNVNLIIGCQNKQSASILYSTIEKNGVLLDLSQEKIWEKEKRLTNYVIEKCSKFNKSISSSVVSSLLEKTSLDFAIIEGEVEKLIIYVGEKNIIELDDVNSICYSNSMQTIWQIADDMIWGNLNFNSDNIDLNNFHLLISAIRYQLQLGYKIAELMENNRSDEIPILFPKIYPRALEKKKEIVSLNGTEFYKEALKALFEMDYLSKSINLHFLSLLDIFKSKLIYLASYASDPASKSFR
ncbi:MAG: hypothetical protein WC688_02490 [Parachlamydiales bacterium]|jgi:DNA polymerase-3 subunit delta